MDVYPWWTEEQKAFSKKVTAFAKELMPEDAETRWRREFPWDVFTRIGEGGYTGAGVPTNVPPEKQSTVEEESLLRVLAEDYRVNPGLHMSRDDLKEHFVVDDEKLDEVLHVLEEKGLVKLFRDRKGMALAKATFDGLDKAFPPDHYQWYPDWIEERKIF